jgi:hypothetical protein
MLRDKIESVDGKCNLLSNDLSTDLIKQNSTSIRKQLTLNEHLNDTYTDHDNVRQYDIYMPMLS